MHLLYEAYITKCDINKIERVRDIYETSRWFTSQVVLSEVNYIFLTLIAGLYLRRIKADPRPVL